MYNSVFDFAIELLHIVENNTFQTKGQWHFDHRKSSTTKKSLKYFLADFGDLFFSNWHKWTLGNKTKTRQKLF